MKKWIFSCWFLSFLGFSQSRNIELRGVLINSFSEPLAGYELRLSGTDLTTESAENGSFTFQLPSNFKSGDLVIRLFNKILQTVPIQKGESNVLDLGSWVVPQQESPIHLLSVDDLNALYEEDTELDRGQIGSVLQSQRDIFLNTVAFQFSPTFFRLRGLDNSNQVVRINGVAIQSFLRGSPSWSQWGGLNDFTNRGQHLFLGSSSQFHGMGGFLSTTQIQLRPSAFRSGTKVSQAFSNSSYRFRSQVSFVKVPQDKSVGYGFLFSRRWGSQGYVKGTFYDAWSGAAMIEKQWNPQHQTWFTAFYTPTRRGKNAPLTREVFNLKGRSYNPHWGLQEGLPRNSRTVRVQAPMMVFNHRWQFNENDFLQLNIGYQWGRLGSSRLLYNGHELKDQSLSGGGQNPDPVYYQYLPSYALRNLEKPDFRNAFFLEKEIKQNGQLNWESLYRANQTSSGFGIYALYEDVQKWNQGSINVQFTSQLEPHLFLRAQGEAIKEHSQFFAMPTDLLGADFLWDYNSYAPRLEQIDPNLNNPNAKVYLKTPFQYHYGIQSREINLSASVDYSNLGLNYFLGGFLGYRSYLRDGYFRTGLYPQNSFGKGTLQSFTTYGIKGGLDYSLTGRHHLSLKGQWIQKPPSFKNVYVNSRENQYIIPDSTFETNQQLVFQYLWEGVRWTLKAKVYGLFRKNLQEVGYYFADGLGGDEALFIQEITQGMNHKHSGIEASFSYTILPEFRLEGVISWGDFRYANHPQVYLGAVSTEETKHLEWDRGLVSLGRSLLKNYALAGGPQRAYSLSIHYEDPSFWRLSVYGNYFSHAYLDPNPLLRTANFYSDRDGLPFADYELETAQKLLVQERFPSYFLLNATAGKSWRIGSAYTGFFISIQNLLDSEYITGGFEQGRNANYRSLREDAQREFSLFAPKYWWGRGTTYFTSFYYRF